MTLHGTYIVMNVVRLLLFSSYVNGLHLPIPIGSSLFAMIDDEIVFTDTVAVLPGLQSEFHAVFVSDVQ